MKLMVFTSTLEAAWQVTWGVRRQTVRRWWQRQRCCAGLWLRFWLRRV